MAESFAGRGMEKLARDLGTVRAALTAARGDIGEPLPGLLDQVEGLGRAIADAKAEIAALGVDDITVRDIPFATDELDAIVAHTAAATNAILESCEALDAIAGELGGGHAAQLQDATTRIYEACGFQDITGQRITKVVAVLKVIEQRIAQIVVTFGAREQPGAVDGMAPEGEAALLNGPQLPASAMEQCDIDALLATFD